MMRHATIRWRRWRPIAAAMLLCLPWLASAASWPDEADQRWAAAPQASPFEATRHGVRTGDPFAVTTEPPRTRLPRVPRVPRVRIRAARERFAPVDGDVGARLPADVPADTGAITSRRAVALARSVSPAASPEYAMTEGIAAGPARQAAFDMSMHGGAPHVPARHARQLDRVRPAAGRRHGLGELPEAPCLGAVSIQQCAR